MSVWFPCVNRYVLRANRSDGTAVDLALHTWWRSGHHVDSRFRPLRTGSMFYLPDRTHGGQPSRPGLHPDIRHRLSSSRSAIPVQPTSVARRRQGLGRGSASVPQGRPIGLKRTAEHGFSKSHHPAPKRRPAPHNRTHCVE